MRWKSVGVVAGEMVIDILKWIMRQRVIMLKGVIAQLMKI